MRNYRTYFTGLALALFAATAFAEDKEITISDGGAAALKLGVPKDAEVTKSKKGEETTISTKEGKIYIWPVSKSASVNDALPHVGEVIKSEFTEYVVASTEDITVAGAKAKHLKGKGAEADDGDPGSADVVIFEVGKHVFAACVHGEKDAAAKQRPTLLSVLKTAKVP